MNTSMQPQTQTAASIPATGYAIGTILHGTNVRKGNLWIITVDQTYEGSLLFDGTTKTVISDSLYKRDRMSPGMRIADPHDIASALGGWKQIPMWAQHLILTSAGPTPLAKPSNVLPQGVINQIHKAVGATATPQTTLHNSGLLKPRKGYSSVYSNDDETLSLRDCPARKDGLYCQYQPYYGFTDTYEYCTHCDHKRAMRK